MTGVNVNVDQLLGFTQMLDRNPEDLVVQGKILIVGAGGVGTWIAIAVALSADPQNTTIILVDDDMLEMVNANRLPLPWTMLARGIAKVEALRLYLRALRPNLPIYTHVARVGDAGVDVFNILERRYDNLDIIVDAVDNIEAIKYLKKKAKEKNLPLLSAHYDGSHYSIEWTPSWEDQEGEEWDTGAGQPQGYADPSTAATPMHIASIAAVILAKRPQQKLTITGDLRKLLNKTPPRIL